MIGVGSIRGGPLQGTQIVGAAFNSYLWHLAGAIPLLQIPSTLNWSLNHPFTDHIQGGLTVLYTITVISPVLYLISQLASRYFKENTNSPGETAAATHTGTGDPEKP
jgi:hypothetical protein